MAVTPKPWMLGQFSCEIMTDDGLAIAAPPEDQGDTEQWRIDGTFIVKACNAHDDLIAALKDCVSALEYAAEDLQGLDKPRAAKACRLRADKAQALIDALVKP